MQRIHKVSNGPILKLFLIAIFVMQAGVTFAKNETKTYPEEGKVIGLGTKQHVAPTGHGFLFPSYTVETETKTFELMCGSGNGCGGDKKLEIGDVIHFRIDQYHGTRCAYIVAPKGNNLTREDRLLILSEELKPDAKDKPAATGPEK
jgi:hypothetical protein